MFRTSFRHSRIIAMLALTICASCSSEEGKPIDDHDQTVRVTGITVNPTSISLKEGESYQLTATIIPEDAGNKKVSWSSSSDAVAVIDNSGKVTGVKAGSATITATTEDGGKKATCSISVEANLAPSLTVDASHISAISAVLAGKANIGSMVAADLQVGFQYSEFAGILPSNSITIEATDADANYNYTASITGLEPDTKYYFRSFVRQNGQVTYGETKEFTTNVVASLLETKEASGIEAAKATLNAKLDLTDVQYESVAYGFLWGASESTLNTDYKCTEINDNAISALLNGLSHKTQYWFKAYIKLDSQSFYGEVKTFTTGVIPVESVSLDKTVFTFHDIGLTLSLNATILPANATDRSVSWTSDKEDVATVNTYGRVRARSNGTATITVTTKDQGKTATCAITVAQHITSISLDKTTLSLNEHEVFALTATINPDNAADKSLKWTSSDESIATVDQAGNVTAISKGTVIIKAEAQDGSGKYASCSVNVIRLVSSITLDRASFVLYRGKTETIIASVLPSDATNTGLTWTSSNSSVATVSSTGVVTGKAPGNVTITAKAKDASDKDAKCEVKVIQYVKSISLDRTSLSLLIGSDATLSVTSILPEDAYDKSYTWTSSNNDIASVDNTGKVIAKAKGNTTIKATANDGSGVYASCSVVVFNMPQAVDMGTVVDGKNIKWASFNIGASSPEEYGLYYAWGETEPKSIYDWSTYKWCNKSSSYLTKYNSYSNCGVVDNKYVLEPDDDAAHVKLGGKWRMPTSKEWRELCNKCSWSSTTLNGVEGRLVKASNGNSIFLPLKSYWSAGLSSYNKCYFAGSLYPIPSGGYNDSCLVTDERCRGLVVRPVSE